MEREKNKLFTNGAQLGTVSKIGLGLGALATANITRNKLKKK